MYRIPRYRIQLVRDGSQASEIKKISSPQEVEPVCRAYLGELDREHFCVLLLDTKNQIIGINTVSIGTLDTSLVHPREIFKPAILASAAGIILFHNHPSGDPTPSREDTEVTKRIIEAGKILGITVLDHIIVGDTFSSLKEKGLL